MKSYKMCFVRTRKNERKTENELRKTDYVCKISSYYETDGGDLSVSDHQETGTERNHHADGN